MISIFGWRHAYFFLSGVFTIVLILTYTFLRDAPEDIGLYPDGEEPRIQIPTTDITLDESEEGIEL